MPTPARFRRMREIAAKCGDVPLQRGRRCRLHASSSSRRSGSSGSRATSTATPSRSPSRRRSTGSRRWPTRRCRGTPRTSRREDCAVDNRFYIVDEHDGCLQRRSQHRGVQQVHAAADARRGQLQVVQGRRRRLGAQPALRGRGPVRLDHGPERRPRRERGTPVTTATRAFNGHFGAAEAVTPLAAMICHSTARRPGGSWVRLRGLLPVPRRQGRSRGLPRHRSSGARRQHALQRSDRTRSRRCSARPADAERHEHQGIRTRRDGLLPAPKAAAQAERGPR